MSRDRGAKGHDRGFIDEAAKRGVFAYVVDGAPDELQGALEITLCRFAEYHNLQGAFGRRAITERAKGILMERHSVDEQRAFTLLRDQARQSGRKLVDIAQAIVDGHSLLPRGSATPAPWPRRPAAASAASESASSSSAHMNRVSRRYQTAAATAEVTTESRCSHSGQRRSRMTSAS